MTNVTIRSRRSFIFSPGLRPEMFPKALESGADIVCVELEDGIAPKDKDTARARTMKLFETPQAEDGVERIVRINCLRESFGIADVQAVLATELRCENAWEPLLYARSRVVHAAASAGLDAIDVPYLDLEDPQGMVAAAKQAKALGFSGKGSIHPKQIAALNEVFTPNAEEIARAQRITETFEEADTGLVVIDGKLIEKPVLRDMYRILAIAERIGA